MDSCQGVIADGYCNTCGAPEQVGHHPLDARLPWLHADPSPQLRDPKGRSRGLDTGDPNGDAPRQKRPSEPLKDSESRGKWHMFLADHVMHFGARLVQPIGHVVAFAQKVGSHRSRNAPRGTPSNDRKALQEASVWPGAALSGVSAMGYLELILEQQLWVNRRVDIYQPVSSKRLSQHSSIDFTVTEDFPSVSTGNDSLALVPIIQIHKKPLSNFDIRDAENREIPILTARQTRTVSATAMLTYADAILRGFYPDGLLFSKNPSSTEAYSRAPYSMIDFPFRAIASNEEPSRAERKRRDETYLIQKGILDIITGDSGDSVVALKRFSKPAARAHLFKVLAQDKAFLSLLSRFADHYFATAVLPVKPLGSRQVIKLDLELMVASKHVSTRTQLADTSLRKAGWKGILNAVGSRLANWSVRAGEFLCILPTTFLREAHAGMSAQSYHVEVRAAAGTKVTGISWYIRPPDLRANTELHPSTSSRRALLKATQSIIEEDFATSRIVTSTPEFRHSGETGLIHSTIRPVPFGYSLFIEWKFAPRVDGWLAIAVIAALASLLTQWAITSWLIIAPEWMPEPLLSFLNWMHEVGRLSRDGGDSAMQNRGALVVGLAALTIGALVRSGEHHLLKRMLAVPRVLSVVVTTCLLLSSVPLMIEEVQVAESWHGYFDVLMLLSVVATAGLVSSLLMALGPIRHWTRRSPSQARQWKVWLWQ